MNLQKFEFFAVLAETLNYTEAAERLFTTQGNVSKQIISLEKELQVKLFHRRHRSIELTPAGAKVLPYAKSILKNYQELRQEIQQFVKTGNQELIIHGIPTMSKYHILQIIGRFHKLHPEITITVEEEESTELFQSLDLGNSSLIVARTFGEKLEGYEHMVIAQERFVAVLPQNHPLAHNEVIKVSDLKDEPFLQLGKSTMLYDEVIDLCQRAGFEPQVSYQGQRIDLILNFVSNEMGVSLMMCRSLDDFQNYDVAVVPVDVERFSKVNFVRRKDYQNKALSLFWDYLEKEVAQDSKME